MMTRDISQQNVYFLLTMELAIVDDKFMTKQSCFWGVDAFRLVPPFDCHFWPYQKIIHNSFQNWTLGTVVPLPKCMKSKAFRHIKL